MKKILAPKKTSFILRILKKFSRMIELRIKETIDDLFELEAKEEVSSPLPLVKGVSWYVYELDGVQLRVGLKINILRNIFYITTGNVSNRNFLKHRKKIGLNKSYSLRELYSRLKMIKHYVDGGIPPIPKPLSTRIRRYFAEVFTEQLDEASLTKHQKKECYTRFGARSYFALTRLFFIAIFVLSLLKSTLFFIPAFLMMSLSTYLEWLTKKENVGWKDEEYFYFTEPRSDWQDGLLVLLMIGMLVSAFSYGSVYGYFSLLFIFFLWIFFAIRAGLKDNDSMKNVFSRVSPSITNKKAI